jgi:hypothetical protein
VSPRHEQLLRVPARGVSLAATGPGRVLSESARTHAGGLGGTLAVLGIILGYLFLLPWIADALDDAATPTARRTVAFPVPATPARDVTISVPEGWEVDRSRVGDEQRIHLVDEDLQVWLTVATAPPGPDQVEHALAQERRAVEETGRVRFAEPAAVRGPDGLTGRVVQYANPVTQGLIGAWGGQDRLVRVRASWAGARDGPAEAVLVLVRSLGRPA